MKKLSFEIAISALILLTVICLIISVHIRIKLLAENSYLKNTLIETSKKLIDDGHFLTYYRKECGYLKELVEESNKTNRTAKDVIKAQEDIIKQLASVPGLKEKYPIELTSKINDLAFDRPISELKNIRHE
jgi:hypothetical protein